MKLNLIEIIWVDQIHATNDEKKSHNSHMTIEHNYNKEKLILFRWNLNEYKIKGEEWDKQKI
jgi:hypothetical protein